MDAATRSLRLGLGMESMSQRTTGSPRFRFRFRLSAMFALVALVGMAATVAHRVIEHNAGIGRVRDRGCSVTVFTPNRRPFHDVRTVLLTNCRCAVQWNGGSLRAADLFHLKKIVGLQYLSLQSTRMRDDWLLQLESLSDLRVLDLRNTNISDAGLAHLLRLRQLRWLLLDGTKVSPDGLKALAMALPNCVVVAGLDEPHAQPNGTDTLLDERLTFLLDFDEIAHRFLHAL